MVKEDISKTKGRGRPGTGYCGTFLLLSVIDFT